MNCISGVGLLRLKNEADGDDHRKKGKHIHRRQGSGQWPEELGGEHQDKYVIETGHADAAGQLVLPAPPVEEDGADGYVEG
jgi:hypothetical protein